MIFLRLAAIRTTYNDFSTERLASPTDNILNFMCSDYTDSLPEANPMFKYFLNLVFYLREFQKSFCGKCGACLTFYQGDCCESVETQKYAYRTLIGNLDQIAQAYKTKGFNILKNTNVVKTSKVHNRPYIEIDPHRKAISNNIKKMKLENIAHEMEDLIKKATEFEEILYNNLFLVQRIDVCLEMAEYLEVYFYNKPCFTPAEAFEILKQVGEIHKRYGLLRIGNTTVKTPLRWLESNFDLHADVLCYINDAIQYICKQIRK